MKPQNTSSTSSGSRIQQNSPGLKTIWPITHSCGHHAERDLSGRAADRRAGFSEWLAKHECTDCWRAAEEGDGQDKAAWLEAKRAEEQAESEAWSEQYRMPPLEGTGRAVAWGVRCRHQILAAAYTALVLERETDETEWEAIEEGPRASLLAPGGESTSAPPGLETSPSCSRPPPGPTACGRARRRPSAPTAATGSRARTPPSDAPGTRASGPRGVRGFPPPLLPCTPSAGPASPLPGRAWCPRSRRTAEPARSPVPPARAAAAPGGPSPRPGRYAYRSARQASPARPGASSPAPSRPPSAASASRAPSWPASAGARACSARPTAAAPCM